MRYWLVLTFVLLSLLSLPNARAEPQQFRAYLPLMRQTAFDLYASTGTQIIRYDGSTGVRLNVAASSPQAAYGLNEFALGQDGNLYVSDGLRIQRYNPLTGNLIDTFIDLTQAGFVLAYNLTFGSDGNLYVTGYQKVEVNESPTKKVSRFQGTTGLFIDNFIPHLACVQDSAQGIRFASDGDIYLLCQLAGVGYHTALQRYSGTSGAFIGTIIPSSDKWGFGLDFEFGPDNDIYVLAGGAGVARFNRETGSFIATFIAADVAQLRSASSFSFGPDGNLYFVRQDNDQVVRFSGSTGAFIDIFVDPVADYYIGQNRLAFYPSLTATSVVK